MAIFRIYPEKSNTIASGSAYELKNAAQTPIADLWYGGGATDTAFKKRNSISRHLLQFDLTDLQNKINSFEINKNYITSIKLKMTNSIPSDAVLEDNFEFDVLRKNIASSFDLIAFPINKSWDEGRGYELEKNIYITKQNVPLSVSGYSNWLSATTTSSWDEPGIFSNPTASTNNYAIQHFDKGSENIDLNITSMVNGWLSGNTNNGVCLSYSKFFEDLQTDIRYISSFYTKRTNTAFKPYLEINYEQAIKDDRFRVANNRPSRLFLFLYSGNSSVNYFSAGTVDIQNNLGQNVYTGLTPIHHSKGVYYVDVFMSGTTKGQRFKDIWKDITFPPEYDVQSFTQTFDIKDNYYTNNIKEIDEYMITSYGISNNEILQTGEVRRLFFDVKINYSQNSPSSDIGLEFKMVMNNVTEVIPWTPANCIFTNNCLTFYCDIDTSWLLTMNDYVVSVRINELGVKKVLEEKTYFKVINSI